MGNSRCCCSSFNITEQHCYWMPVQPLTASYLVRIPVLEITSLYFSVNSISSIPFLSFQAMPIPYKPLSQSFTISEGRNCWKNLQIKRQQQQKRNKKKKRWLFWRDSVIFKKAPGPRFSSVLSFLHKYKSNW